MRKLNYGIVATLMMCFLCLPLTSCKLKNLLKDKDDDKEEVSKRNNDDDDEDSFSFNTENSNVTSLCNQLKKYSDKIAEAETEAEAEDIIDRIDIIIQKYFDDTTPLTDGEKEQLVEAIAYMYGVMIAKAVYFETGVIDEDELSPIVEEIGVNVALAIDASSNLSEIEDNLDLYVNSEL